MFCDSAISLLGSTQDFVISNAKRPPQPKPQRSPVVVLSWSAEGERPGGTRSRVQPKTFPITGIASSIVRIGLVSMSIHSW